MKKIILFSFALILGLVSQTQAQSEDYRFNVGLSTNYTFTGALFNGLIRAAEGTSTGVNKKSFPSLQLTADYGITKLLSVGVAASYQTIGFDATDDFINGSGSPETENYSLTWTRTSIALRPLIHYANTDRLDMYSGLRIQWFNGTVDSDSSDPDRVDDFTNEAGIDPNLSKIGVGIVAYGVRYYFTENIGAGTEINIGRPYVVNFSINARF